MQISEYIDHTLLKATATPDDIETLCEEAVTYNFKAVCVNSCYVHLAVKTLENDSPLVAAVVGFPLGAMATEAKVAEAKKCIKEGADEIDMVLNVGFLKAELYKSVREEITAIKKAIGRRTLKVILEVCYLTDAELKMACKIAKKAGADFVKTSTGFGPGNATLHSVKLMKEAVGDSMQIKASGGIRDYKTAMEYIEMGASRIGTSSGVAIVTQKNTTDESSY
ncbi:deoxyribose-phosphate aldolase [Luteirhabdus pelagi]|uniref:deoxyribose-phosphate aldolase n=1 Tax=Luteirhabdus pelagi TaxID=2792783 RepID=UPI00193AAE87|nr:deoxyribose-phosphate aldolase [Luteirhabdus pelagi]